MSKEYNVQEALRMAIRTEKDSMDFYKKAASVTKNARAKKVFRLLADEEVEHLKSFFVHYEGSEFGEFATFLQSPPDKNAPTYMALKNAIDRDTHEQKALEIALHEEKACIDHYTQFARDIVDPLVRSIFERVVKETRKHHEMIESEYAHVMGMVHESDQDIYVRE
ncbi:MAG: ferritin [Geobacteraceae bacterium]|nr:ferritin [Geobacteraceae bacterium]